MSGTYTMLRFFWFDLFSFLPTLHKNIMDTFMRDIVFLRSQIPRPLRGSSSFWLLTKCLFSETRSFWLISLASQRLFQPRLPPISVSKSVLNCQYRNRYIPVLRVFHFYDWNDVDNWKNLLLNRWEIYRMVIEICKNVCTLCPLYCPDQGDIVGREYIIFYKFLLPYGISLRDSTITNSQNSVWKKSFGGTFYFSNCHIIELDTAV
jgi:hypothetical protein